MLFFLFLSLQWPKWSHLKRTLVHHQTLDHWQRMLVAIYKDGTETCKKLFTVADASQLLQACHSEFSHSVQLERFLKYNDFQDYVDCDTSTYVKDYDKFQVRVATVVQLEFMEFETPHVENEKVTIFSDFHTLSFFFTLANFS